MKRIIFIYTSLFISLIFLITSCEANKHINLTVLNFVTHEPIDSVYIKVNAGKNGDYNKSYTEGYTDKKGEFEEFLMIGCAFGCYDIFIEYSKSGYVTKKELNRTEGIILLTPN